MATRYYRRLYGRRYTRRYPYRRSRYTSATTRRAVGNYKAASQQKDSTQVNLNITHKCSTTYKNTSMGDEVTKLTGVYALNIWDLLRRSEFYQSYANMYDQVKIDRIRLKLTPVNWTFNTQTTGAFKAITVVTAWDRSGLSEEQIYLKQNIQTDSTGAVIGGVGDTDGLYVTMNEEIGTYSSAQTRNLNPNSSLSIVRYLYPSSMQEKAQYVNTADLKEWYSGFDVANGRFYGIDFNRAVLGSVSEIQDSEAIADVVLGLIENSNAVKNNPSYLLEDPSVPFKPTFLLGLQTGFSTSQIPANTTVEGPVFFNVEADVGVTFRGLRKAKIVE